MSRKWLAHYVKSGCGIDAVGGCLDTDEGMRPIHTAHLEILEKHLRITSMTPRHLAGLYREAHNEMRNIDGLQPQEAFDELLKYLLLKETAAAEIAAIAPGLGGLGPVDTQK